MLPTFIYHFVNLAIMADWKDEILMKEMASKQLIEKLIGLVKLVEKQNERVMLAVVDRTQKEFAKCKSHAERDKVLTEFIQTIQGFGIAGGHKVKIVVNENGSWKLLLV